MRLSAAATAGGLLLLLVFLVGPAQGVSRSTTSRAPRPGQLDPSFGRDGKVRTYIGDNISEGTAHAEAVVIQRDGKIVAGGGGWIGSNGSNAAFALARYRPDGRLDRTFGTHGIVATAVPQLVQEECCPPDPSLSDLVLLPRGKILALGQSATEDGSAWVSKLVRYRANGKLDGSFGQDGMVTNPAFLYAIGRQRDGKIVAVGGGFKVVRFNPNGSVDSSFGKGGSVTPSFGGLYQNAHSVAIQPDGKIVIGGSRLQDLASDYEYALARLNPNGSLDPTFGTAGTVVTATGSCCEESGVLSVLIEPDGKIVAAGNGYLARYHPNGSLDPTFGDGGIAVAGNGGLSAEGAALQSDGKLVLAGNVPGRHYVAFAVSRYTRTGSPDSHFGADGLTKTEFSWSSAASAVAVQRDGKIVAAGFYSTSRHHPPGGFALIRYLRGSERCVVPRVVGRRLGNARQTIRRRYCSVGKVTTAFSARVGKRRVVSQEPKAGRRRPFGAKLELVVSMGKRRR